MSAAERIVTSVPCPLCKADVGEFCTVHTGLLLTRNGYSHASRIAAAAGGGTPAPSEREK
jgi:hypothetical protein